MKKFISILVSIASVLSVCNPCLGAEDNLPQMDTAISGEYEIIDKQVIPQIGVRFSDLNVWGNALLRIFKDDTKEVQLAADDTLSNGNYIELEENGVFDYYTVYSNIRELLFTATNASDMGAVARGVVTDENGVGGRAEDDTSILLTSTGADGSASVYSGYKNHEIGQVVDGEWVYENSDGYLVFEASIMPVGTTIFKLCTNQSRGFFGETATIALNTDMWNKVIVVYDFENKRAKRIVNGEESEWISPQFGTNNWNVLRVLFEGEPNKTSAYLDDYKIYISDDVPENKAAPSLDDELYTIIDSIFITDGTIRAGDVVCDGASVNIFKDNSYSEPVDFEDYLESGYIIVLTGTDGSVTYYTVSTEEDAELLSWWNFDESNLSDSGNVYKSVNAGGGIPETDMVMKSKSWICLKANGLPQPSSDMTAYTGYLIISMNVMSPSETTRFSIATNQGNTIAATNIGGTLYTNEEHGFKLNRWNSFVTVIKVDGNATGNGIATTYINGEEKFVREGHNLFDPGKDNIRVAVDTSSNSTDYISFNNIKAKFVDEAPTEEYIASLTAMPVLEDIAEKAAVNGDNYEIMADVTVAELSAGNADIRVFESEAFEAELAQTDILSTGNIIVVTDAMGKISYYVAVGS